MIPNRAQFMIHGMLSLSLSLFMCANQNASSYKIRQTNAFSRRPKSLAPRCARTLFKIKSVKLTFAKIISSKI